MRRRHFVGCLSTFLTAGCLDGVGVANPNNDNGMSVEAAKENATSIPYDDLIRDIKEYEGEPVHYTDARVEHILEHTESKQEFIVQLPADEFWPDTYCYAIWRGTPQVRKYDSIEFWAIVEGLILYDSAMGERTVPELSVLDVVVMD